MSTPYGGNDPQQWGQQPYGGGQPGQPGEPGSGGFPAQGHDQWQQQQWGQQPGGAYPQSGPQPQQPGQEQQWQQPGAGQQWQQPQQQWAPEQQWQQPQPGGYPGQFPGYPQPQQKSKAPLWIGLGVLVLLLGAVAVLLFWKPGFLVPKVFDSSAVEKGVEQIRPEVEKGATSCPDDQKVEKDHTFSCTVKVNGEDKKVQIKVVDEDKAQYEVGPVE